MKTWQIVVIAIIAIIVLIGLWIVRTHNVLVALKNRVEEAFSGMDVHLQKRYDLIPNLVNTVKGYTKHESETLENVVKARNSALSATSPADKIKAEGELSQTLGRLLMLTENYPDLKASSQFMDLQNQLNQVETEIASSRKYYNGVVRTYNTAIQKIPTNIIAGMFGFTKEPLFEIQDEVQRQNVTVEF